jgi:hypothetical protein
LTSINDLSNSKIENSLYTNKSNNNTNSERKAYPLPIKLMHKKLQSENKEKLIKRLNMINEKLEPQFRLSQIDMEDLINSKTLSHSFATEAKTN